MILDLWVFHEGQGNLQGILPFLRLSVSQQRPSKSACRVYLV